MTVSKVIVIFDIWKLDFCQKMLAFVVAERVTCPIGKSVN